MKPYEKIIHFLKSHSVRFQELTHEPVYTSEQAAKVRGVSAEAGAKSLLLKAKGVFALAVVGGDKKVSSSKLRKILKKQDIRFATPEEVKEIMGCEIGACYPFGCIAGIDTYLDKSLLDKEFIYFNPGIHTKTIEIRSDDLIKITNPKVVDLIKEF